MVDIPLGWRSGSLVAISLIALAILLSLPILAEDVEPDFIGLEGQPLALNVTVDPGGPVDRYRWDFDGDGNFDVNLSQPNITHIYEEGGDYQAVLAANLSNGSVRMWIYLVRIETRNQAPVVVIVGHSTGYTETDRLTPVTLDGTAVDDGDVVRYEWDFDGDGAFDWSSTAGANVDHTYGELGSFTAVLRATDDEGANGTATLTVEVVNLAPVIGLVGSFTAYDPTVTLTTTAEDPDGEIVVFTWDLDDGSPMVNTTVPRITHTYPDERASYRAEMVAWDDDGGSSSFTFFFDIAEGDVYIVHQVDAGDDVFTVEGKHVQFNVNVSEGTEAIEHYYWDLTGDGVTDVDGRTTTYMYSQPGTYDVTVSVVDEWGYAVNDSLVVTVYPEENEPPVPVPSVEQWTRPGRNLRFSEASYDPDGSIVLYQWDFDGDGTFDHADTKDGNVTHLYVDEGVYVAVLQVTDNRGEVASVPVTIKVNNDAPDENDVDDSKGAAVCCVSMVVVMVVIAYWTMRKSVVTPRKDGGPAGQEDKEEAEEGTEEGTEEDASTSREPPEGEGGPEPEEDNAD